MTLKVAPSDRDRWLVLGQSYNDGWRASTDAGSLGPQLLVNGYANGWKLPAHAEPLVVHLRWTPQRIVNIALALSAVAAVLVLVLALGFFSRSTSEEPATSAASLEDAEATGGFSDAIDPPGPTWWPWLVVGLVALFGGLGPGLVALAATRLAARRAWRRWVLLVPPILLGGVVAIMVYKQVRYDLPADLGWPAAFPFVPGLAWCAIAAAAGAASVWDQGER